MIIRRKCSMCGEEIEEDSGIHRCHGDELDLLIDEERIEEWEDDKL